MIIFLFTITYNLSMKKIFPLLFGLHVTICSYSQAVKYKMDSLIYHYRDDLGDIQSSQKNEYTYDSNGDCIVDNTTYLNFDNGKWTKGSKTLFYFDDRHNDTLTISTNWSEEEQKYISYNKYVETYDANNRRTTMTQFNLDPKTDQWVRIWKRAYTYDAKNRILTELHLDSLKNALVNSYKYEFDYTAAHNNKYNYNWRDGAWKLTMLDENILDVNGDEVRTATYFNQSGASNENPVWENSSKYEHTYNKTHDRTGTYYYSWEAKTWLGDDYQWIPKSYIIFNNDAFHNNIFYEARTWNKEKQIYEPEYRVERTYNTEFTYKDFSLSRNFTNDNHASSTFMYMLLEDRFAGFVNNSWTEYTPNSYYYSPMTVTGVEERNAASTIAYPNPMKDVLYVSGNVLVFDIYGHQVASGMASIDVSALPKGLYFVQSTSGNIKLLKE